MNFSLTRIRSFAAVAEEGQFRKASERLRVSQPALSTHISELEHQLGVRLLNRTTRSVRLTAEGERFLRRVQAVLHDLDGAVSEMRDQALLRRGRLTIAATPSVMANILPGALSKFTSRFPGVHLEAVEDTSVGVERRVEEGQVDFGIGPLPSRRSDLDFLFLLRDRFVSILPAGHTLSKRKAIDLRHLADETLITTLPGTNIYNILVRALEKSGLEIHPRYTMTQHQTVVAMIAAGLGVALLPALTLATLDCSRVTIAELKDVNIVRDIGILQRKGGASSSACREFVSVLQKLCGQTPKSRGRFAALT